MNIEDLTKEQLVQLAIIGLELLKEMDEDLDFKDKEQLINYLENVRTGKIKEALLKN